jgi:hypothetical protein
MNAWDFRGIFFKDALGHVAVTLPILFAMMFISVVMIPVLVLGIIRPIIHLIQKVATTGQLIGPINFDLFYLNAKTLPILGIITILCLLFTLGMGRKRLLKQNLLSWDLLTLVVYSFFAAWWTGQSVWNAVRGKKKAWR